MFAAPIADHNEQSSSSAARSISNRRWGGEYLGALARMKTRVVVVNDWKSKYGTQEIVSDIVARITSLSRIPGKIWLQSIQL